MKERYTSKVAVFLVLTREVDGKTETLLQERCNTGYKDGQYDVACSGHLEKGETIGAAIVREAKEEIDIDIQEKDLEVITVVHYPPDDYLNIFFKVRKYEGVPKIMEPNKCDDLSWFSVDQLPTNTIERTKNVLNMQKEGRLYLPEY